MRVLLRGILSSTGHTLFVAENGLEALEVLEAQPIDLLLTDINMPKLDGLELLERLKDKPDLIKLAMSARGSQVGTLESLGVTDFFEKPLDIKRLRQRVTSLLE